MTSKTYARYEPTTSMKWVQRDKESFVVELVVHGMKNENRPEAALKYIQSLLCSSEIKAN